MDLLSLLILSTTWSMLRREEEDEEEAAEAEAGGEVVTSWLKKGKGENESGGHESVWLHTHTHMRACMERL